MAILKSEQRYAGMQCFICRLTTPACIVRYPAGKSLATGGAQYVHDQCSDGWTRFDGSTVGGTKPRPRAVLCQCGHLGSQHKNKTNQFAGGCAVKTDGQWFCRCMMPPAEVKRRFGTQKEEPVAKNDTTIKPSKGTVMAGSLLHIPTTKNRWYSDGHRHGLSKATIREYMAAGRTDGIAIRCFFLRNGYDGFTPVRFEHGELVKVAAARGLPTGPHVCENVVTREEVVTKEVIVERGASTWKELSFGEAASLTASLQHGQHILNDDLRRAMKADDREEIERCHYRLADHMSLMDKLGVPRADWSDNYQAMLRAGRVELDLPVVELSIWS